MPVHLVMERFDLHMKDSLWIESSCHMFSCWEALLIYFGCISLSVAMVAKVWSPRYRAIHLRAIGYQPTEDVEKSPT